MSSLEEGERLAWTCEVRQVLQMPQEDAILADKERAVASMVPVFSMAVRQELVDGLPEWFVVRAAHRLAPGNQIGQYMASAGLVGLMVWKPQVNACSVDQSNG